MKNTLSGQLGQNAIPVEKHIYDYVVTDSKIERAFAKELDVSNVCKQHCFVALLVSKITDRLHIT